MKEDDKTLHKVAVREADAIAIAILPSLSFFVSGAFCGFFLTAWPTLTHDNWPYWVGGRIVWQLGGAIWFGIVAFDVIRLYDSPLKSAILGATAGTLVGLALCFNPVLDVLYQPQIWEGQITQVKITKGKLHRRRGFSETIQAHIEIQTSKGKQLLKLVGMQASLWAQEFEACRQRSGRIQATVLRHLDVVLEANCHANEGEKKAPS